MRINIQVVSNHILEQIPSIFVFINNRKYIFNIPQQQNRYLQNYHHYKYSGSMCFFFTKACSATIGGLLPFIKEIYSRQRGRDCKFYLPNNIFQYLTKLRFGIGMKIFPISYYNIDTHEHQIGIGNMNCAHQLIKSKSYRDFSREISNEFIQSKIPEKEQNRADKFVKREENFLFQDGNLEIRNITIDGYSSFLCKVVLKLNQVVEDKVEQLGLTQAEITKIMTKGKVVHNGKQITVTDINTTHPSPNFLLLHYESPQHLTALMQHPIFISYIEKHKTNCVVHIVEGDGSVLLSKEYKQLLGQLGKDVKHIIHNGLYGSKDMINEAYHHEKFTSLVHNYLKVMPNTVKLWTEMERAALKKRKEMKYMDEGYQVEGSKRAHEMVMYPLRFYGYHPVEETRKRTNWDDLLATCARPFSNYQDTLPPPLPQQLGVVFLGTSSTASSRYRNVSGIVIELPNNHYMIWDCGQGTYSQLVNHYGAEAENILINTNIIFISHLHYDHCTGIFHLIEKRAALGSNGKLEKLYLILPANMINWFKAYTQNMGELNCQVLFTQTLTNQPYMKTKIFKPFCHSDDFQHQNPLIRDLIYQNLNSQKKNHQDFKHTLKKLGIQLFKPVPVLHCPHSYGIVMQHEKKGKISYSGDCRPTEQFVQAAEKSNVLIHEATFDDQQYPEAKRKYHSTVSEAIDVGVKSQSQLTVLTHFSSRFKRRGSFFSYPSLYKQNKEKYQYSKFKTCIAFDHLSFKLNQSSFLPKITMLISQSLPVQYKS